MLHVSVGRLPMLEFNELQSEEYSSQNNRFYSQGFSPFQAPDLILHALYPRVYIITLLSSY